MDDYYDAEYDYDMNNDEYLERVDPACTCSPGPEPNDEYCPFHAPNRGKYSHPTKQERTVSLKKEKK